jgi:iron complex outermembrane receptor protein
MTGNARRKMVPGTNAIVIAIAAITLLTNIAPKSASAEADLADLSLEELMNAEVTSVSKKAQSKNDAAAAITVITSEDLRRGGFTSVPDALRVVPGIQVAQIDSNRWAISARGFNSGFSNKLLVMIDGRSVYTPLFGGVYWDIQDYPLEDIERIEVIRGPGGTVWGANAVNGVINVITKQAKDTQGVLLSAYAGNREQGGTGRYGLAIGENTHARVFGRGFHKDDNDVDKQRDGHDSWTSGHVGFRSDSELTDKDGLRVSADYYKVDEDQRTASPLGGFAAANYEAQGGNVLLRWQHEFNDESQASVQAYYDRTYRDSSVEEDRHTAAIEIQHDFKLADLASVTWGGHYRFSTTHINSTGPTSPTFSPNDEDFQLASGFVQVQLDFFDDRLSLIAGTKLGYNNWSGFEYQPSGRLIYKPTHGHAVWGAVSRAVRTPNQLERDLTVALPVPALGPGALALLRGDTDTRSEDLTGFEAGYRYFAHPKVSLELSAFYFIYDDISSTSVVPVAPPPPIAAVLRFGNDTEVDTRGLEIEVNLLPADWWRMTLGYTLLDIDVDLKGGPGTVALTDTKKTNPRHQFVLRNIIDLPYDFELDTSLYYTDGLNGVIPAAAPGATTKNVEQYVRLDLRLGYKPTDWLELSLVGQNLTDARHYEFNDIQGGQATQVPRSGFAMVTFRH